MAGERYTAFRLRLCIGWLLYGAINTLTFGEVTLDGSMGPSGTLSGPKFQIDAAAGRQLGSNLFHSFSRFNVNTGETATFNGTGATSSVENILSRVTGGTSSNIDGTLRTRFENSSPNLFLINPAGIVFGPSARLDVQGSFHASTGDFIRLADGRRFDAVPSAKDALLSTARPSAFGFLRAHPGPMAFQGSTLEVPEGKTLSVIAGDMAITSSRLQALGGEVNVGSVASPGEVTLGGATLGTGSFTRLGKINMTQRSSIDVSEAGSNATGGGHVLIRAGQFVMDNSRILANTQIGNGKGIDVELTDDLVMKKESSIEASTSGPAKGGSVAVKAGRLQLKEIAQINVNTSGPGKGGNLVVEADEIVLEGEEDEMKRRPGLSARSSGTKEGSGPAGDITVKAGRLQLKERAVIEADTEGPGKGGNLVVEADEIVLGGRTDLSVRARGTKGGSGPAGDITVKADRLRLKEHGEIGVTTFGPAKGGNLVVEADEIVLGETSALIARAKGKEKGSGPAGDITVKADRLRLKEDAEIRANTDGPGQGGSLTINVGDLQLSDRSAIHAETAGTGFAGKLFINATNIDLRDGASISSESISESRDAGQSGEILIRARDSLRLFNDSHITVATQQANAGNITLDVGFLLQLRDGSSITTSVAPGPDGKGTGSGGDININSDPNIDPVVFVVLDGGSRIMANALEGTAGNIFIRTDFLFGLRENISASSEEGIDGVVDIESPDTDVISSALELPESFLDVSTLLTQGCAPGADLSRLVVRKYEVLPDSPAALRVPPPSGLLNADAQNGETLGPGFEHSSDCDGDG